jgi:hypothetical protein
MHWLAHVLGLDDASGGWYLWWSGFGGRIVLGGGFLATYLRQHNCHESRCWRLGKHHIEGTPYVVCRKHHPDT